MELQAKFDKAAWASAVALVLVGAGLVIGAIGLLSLQGCSLGGSGAPTAATEEKKEEVLSITIPGVDQLSSLDTKLPDGQYLAVKLMLKNLSNNALVINPAEFTLGNITEDPKQKYSQPAEKGLPVYFGRVYGKETEEKVLDFAATNLYPRMQVERYIVFMVPSDAKVDGYELTYQQSGNGGLKVTVPLVTSGTTTINDQRTQSGSDNADTTEPTQQ